MKKCAFCRFIMQYVWLSVFTAISVVIAIISIFLKDIPELFPYFYEFYTLINTLGLAIIANFLFCFFQIFIPDLKGQEKTSKSVKAALSHILRSISDPFEHIYVQKNKKSIPFSEIPDFELADLLVNFDLTQESTFHGIGKNGELFAPPYSWILYSYALKDREEIERLINLLGSYLDSDLISLLLNIHRCQFYEQVVSFHNCGVLDRLNSWAHDDSLVVLKNYYIALKKHMDEY